MTMSEQTETHRTYGFVIGLAAGTVVGACLALWLAPQAASELRKRATESARRVGADATKRYRDAGARVGAAVDQVAEVGQDARDGLADAVVRGAKAVERHATATKSSRPSKADSDGPTAPAERALDAV
jgi:gas vesicle protein